jgi:transcriptional regulator with PAS, ATPase and Fis domain
VGRFELAKGGTIFLDEIAEVRPEIQVKLLRIIEERAFERVGGTSRIPMEARIVAATNRNLADAIKEGTFREDLYFRLSTVPVFLPPLKERREDIPLIVQHLIEKFNRKLRKSVRGIDPKLLKWFCKYSWPGNVRELEHVIEYCFVFVKGPIITRQHLPPKEDGARYDEEFRWDETCPSPLLEGEKYVIVRALEMANSNRSEAARILKISRGSLWRKMKRHGIE